MARARVDPKQLPLFSTLEADAAHGPTQQSTHASPAARRLAPPQKDDPGLRVGAAGFIPDPLMRPAWQIDGKPVPALRDLKVPPADPTADAHQPECSEHPAGLQEQVVLRWDFRTTFPPPLEAAVEAGKIDPSDCESENLAALHEEHERAAMSILSDIDAVAQARRSGTDPATGKPPGSEKQRERLARMYAEQPPRLRHAFDVLIDVYAEAFGDDAATCFRHAVEARHAGITVVASEGERAGRHQYDPGHPWHYLPCGDGAAPVPFDAIPAATSPPNLPRLPREHKRRGQQLRSILADAVSELQADELRYCELLERGVDALSEYDRTIAYGGNDQLAWASAVALKYNHVSCAKARMHALRSLA